MVFTDTTEGDVAERLWEFPEDWRTAIEVMDVVRLVGPLNGTVTLATAVSAPTPGATIEDDTEGAPNTVNNFLEVNPAATAVAS